MTSLQQMSRESLAGSLKGQRMHVPDLEAIFAGWPSAFNPELESLRTSVDERLKAIVDSQYKHKSERALALKKLQAPNYALLGAYWWPYVDEQTLHIMTYLAIWIALWDDVFETEASTFGAGALADNWEEAQSYRYQTLLYIRQALRLPCGSYQDRPDTIFITGFDDVALHVNAHCSDEQRERLYTRLEQHVVATAEKQRLRLLPSVPTLDAYLSARMSSSGVRVCATLLEISQEPTLPPTIRQNPLVQKLLDQVNIIILVTNDMCSLKSKVSRGSVDNLVALLWLAHADLDSAVAVAASVLEAARKDFDETAAALMDEFKRESTVGEGVGGIEDIDKLVTACQAVCTGNLVWSLSTRRYDLHLEGKEHIRTIVL